MLDRPSSRVPRRRSRSTSALVSAQPHAPAFDLVAPSLACNVQLASLDRRRKVARYDVYLANGAATPVTCRFYGTRKFGEIEFGLLDVAGASTAHSQFSVAFDGKRRCERLYVQLVGDDVSLLAESQPPWPRDRGVRFRAGAMVGALGLGMLAIVGGGTWLAFPARPPAAPVAAAVLPVSQVVAPAPVAAPAPAQIVSLAARRDHYAGAASLLVSYGAVADGGELRVLDPHGKVVGSAPFSRGGTTRIPLLPALAAVPLHTQLVVRRGHTQALASIDVPPDAPAGASPAPGAAPARAASSADPIVLPQRARSGQAFRVAIRTPLPAMKLTLQDAGGETMEEELVPAGARSVTFTAPDTATEQIYYLACTYQRDAAEETIVRALPIGPR